MIGKATGRLGCATEIEPDSPSVPLIVIHDIIGKMCITRHAIWLVWLVGGASGSGSRSRSLKY